MTVYPTTKPNYSGLFSGCVLNLDLNGDALDSSGQGNDGTVTGATLAIDRFGIANNCYDFAGDTSGDRIELVNTGSSLSMDTAFTVSCFVNMDDITATSYHFITKGDLAIPHINYYLRSLSDGTFQFVVYGLTVTNVATIGTYSASDWHMVTGIYDGSKLLIYVNGVEDNAVLSTGTPTTNTKNVFIGARLSADHISYAGETNGMIDQPLIWNRALSAGEVKALYDLTKNTPNLHEYPR